MAKSQIIVLILISSIVALLVTNFFLLRRNSFVIDQNKEALQDAAEIKVKMTEVMSNLHLLDLGIRGYALTGNSQIGSAYDTAIRKSPKILVELKQRLARQGFPLTKLVLLEDSVQSYVSSVVVIDSLIKNGNRSKAVELINLDKGYYVWLFHAQLSSEVQDFENAVIAAANIKYQGALRNSYVFQLLLTLLILPTLAFLAYYTIRVFRLSEKLLASEAEKTKILFDQKTVLEKMVEERTREIATQNEEIISQKEEIQTHNEKLLAQQKEIENQSLLLQGRNAQLEEATTIILEQKTIIERENLQLAFDLQQQNKELQHSNQELAQRNTKMEQFAFIVSHNLRAPVARLLGLTDIFKYAVTKQELENLIGKTHRSAADLDLVIRELSEIMQARNLNTEVFKEVLFNDILRKATLVLEKEIESMGVSIETDFKVSTIYSSQSYIESIFYNLISNGIKYRHPNRTPIIAISSAIKDELLCLEFKDNGLGFDDRYKEDLFSLYKRFHFHVEGRGVGLYLVKIQIELLGGSIEASNLLQGGSQFRILLPLTSKL